jgi:signal transduction histidine kinase
VTRPWRSLRVRLAVLGFAAIAVPVLLLLGVATFTEDETSTTVDGVVVDADTTTERSPWVRATSVALVPVAAGLAWWWAGRAVAPIERVRTVADDIGGTDLGRRIGLDRGPSEVVALAASFDAMLGRLQQAAELQRRLVEETSHELRTPLAVLATGADVLLAHPEPTVEVYRAGVERSRRAATRMQVVIDALLVDARGRARAIERRPADLVALVRDVVDDATVVARARGVELAVAGPATAPAAVDDATVRRALANLVDNAVRHAPAGSVVEIEIEDGLDGSEGAVAVAVTDHGPGIPVDEQERVFERFWRGTGGPGGTAPGAGLGLPIARQVAQAHGGDVELRSPGATGDGCTFRLTLRR